MTALTELAESHTSLSPGAVDHIQRLVAAWSLPADLAFADLVLYAPADADGAEFIVLGHIRSVTGPTVHLDDPVGQIVSVSERPSLRRCWADGIREEISAAVLDEEVEVGKEGLSVDHVPVRFEGRSIAVLAREGTLDSTRQPGGLEAVYHHLWDRFAVMVEQGSFPLVQQRATGEFREPRVGDGVLVLDREGRVEFASPNATSALHRLGVRVDTLGQSLDGLGLDSDLMSRALVARHSTISEIDTGDVSVVARCHPLLDDGRATGAVLIVRDVTELRSRDRLLLSKDTTIREIHHRVKNNLQTIQSLLRLQARRLQTDEARAAVEHSARRIGAIAIVHETLASDVNDAVDFRGVVDQVVRLVEEGLTSPDRPLRVEVAGSVGELAGEVAMPLAVAVAELVQNALDHSSGDSASITLALGGTRREVHIRVVDDGRGVPDGFRLDRDAGLGLTIVRTFVVSDLEGTMTIGPAQPDEPRGTVVELRVPRIGPDLPLG